MITTLPPEVLGMIFKNVRNCNEEKQMVGAVCKQFLPYTRANLFNDVNIKSPPQLASLIASLATSHHETTLGSLITSLTIGPLTFDATDISQSQLVALFRRLSSLHTLKICGTSRIAQIAISEEVLSTSFSQLKSLTLEGVFGHWTNPLDRQHYASLGQIRSLSTFYLFIGPSLDSWPPSLPQPSSTPPATQLRKFVLEGDLAANDATPLVSSLSSLDTLHLLDTSISPNLIPLLKSIDFPYLMELEVRYDNSTVPIPLPLDEVLPRFNCLHKLTLGRSTFSFDLFDVLPSCSALHHLTFTLGAEISAEGIMSLVERSTSLRSLTFDNVFGAIGPAIVGNTYYSDEDEYYSDSDSPSTSASTCQGWQLPVWTSLFTKEDAIGTVRCAKRNGVVVDGTLLEAVKVQTQWEKEWAKAHVYDKGAWDDLR